MMIIKNSKLVKKITFGFAYGITIWPFILFSDEPSEIDINHEKIHLKQQVELWLIGFYLWYGLEAFKGYFNNHFEKEAYSNERNLDYLKTRKRFSFLKY